MRSARSRRPTWLPIAIGSAVLVLASVEAAAAQPGPETAEPGAAAVEGAPSAPAEALAADTAPPEPAPPASPAPGASTSSAEPAPELSPLRQEIKSALELAKFLTTRVWTLKGNNTLSAEEARAHEDQLNALSELLGSFDESARELEASEAWKKAPQSERDRIERPMRKQVRHATDTLAAIGTQLDAVASATGWTLVDKLLSARCSTAICFDNGKMRHWLGIEPLVELPIGIGFAVSGSALADYVNNHDIRVDLAAGVRVWLFRDVVSLSIYISKPLLDTSIRLRGSDFVYPGASTRRPFPGFALGLLFDSIWVGFDRNELRNGDGKDSSALNPDFPPNQVVSSAWTLTLALQPVTAFRTAIGTAVQSSKAGSE